MGEIFYLHNVSWGSFTIFLGYFQVNNFDIDVFVEKIINLAKESNLCSHGWKIHRPLVNKSKYIKFSEDDLHSEDFITSEAV